MYNWTWKRIKNNNGKWNFVNIKNNSYKYNVWFDDVYIISFDLFVVKINNKFNFLSSPLTDQHHFILNTWVDYYERYLFDDKYIIIGKKEKNKHLYKFNVIDCEREVLLFNTWLNDIRRIGGSSIIGNPSIIKGIFKTHFIVVNQNKYNLIHITGNYLFPDIWFDYISVAINNETIKAKIHNNTYAINMYGNIIHY